MSDVATADQHEGEGAVHDGRTARPRATPGEARVLARACAVAGLLAGVFAVLPFSPTAPAALNAAFCALGLALATALWWWRDRLPAAAAHAVVVVASLCVAGAVAASTTPAGIAVTAVGAVWVTLFSAVFHGRRAMLGHLALVLGGLGTGLLAAGATSPLHTWAFIGVTAAMVGGVVNGDVGRLRDRADLDTLTGALTRAAFRARAESAMAEARRRGEPLALVLIDLDDFKQVNDVHGHAAGDRVLAELTVQWRTGLRACDLLGRHGGDEFVVLLRAASADSARETVDRLRAITSAGAWSAGLAPWSGEAFEEWLAGADADLYRHKHSRPAR